MFVSAHFSICRPLNALLPAQHSHILSLAGTSPRSQATRNHASKGGVFCTTNMSSLSRAGRK